MKRADDANIYLVELTKAMYQALLSKGHSKVSTQGVIDTLDALIKTMEAGEK
ncbi:hypothetical protein CPT_Silence41 [Bacillus phage Silence]|nr:hypothetical protein CPT_Silence41 [Bacillus phage Silence]